MAHPLDSESGLSFIVWLRSGSRHIKCTEAVNDRPYDPIGVNRYVFKILCRSQLIFIKKAYVETGLVVLFLFYLVHIPFWILFQLTPHTGFSYAKTQENIVGKRFIRDGMFVASRTGIEC